MQRHPNLKATSQFKAPQPHLTPPPAFPPDTPTTPPTTPPSPPDSQPTPSYKLSSTIITKHHQEHTALKSFPPKDINWSPMWRVLPPQISIWELRLLK